MNWWRKLQPRHSLRARILWFMVALLVAVQLLTIIAVGVTSDRFVKRQIAGDVDAAARVFQQFFDDRFNQLVLGTRLLSDDFAFKQAYATGDHGTLYSALENLRVNRISADLMLLLDDADLSTIADTRSPTGELPPFPYVNMIEAAEDSGRPVWAMELLDNQLYRLIVVPLLAPEPVAWIVVGFVIDDELARSLGQLTNTDLAFVYRVGEATSFVSASTLAPDIHPFLIAEIVQTNRPADDVFIAELAEEQVAVRVMTLQEQVVVVLTRSVEHAMEPFRQLYKVLLSIATAGLLVLITGAALIAHQVTHPVLQLAQNAREVQGGNYQVKLETNRQDEIGQLVQAFNQMTRGLHAFVRFVPIRLVRRLLEHGLDSDVQHRFSTIIYTDIAQFTALAEELSPSQVVATLNDYFSAVTAPIEKYHGTITQYQGDAILAVFNLFGDDPNHAENAVRAALDIQEILLARRFGDRQLALQTRIGINTGSVVAGAVGSSDRLNYTVHGDAVNLAARLESVNKRYGSQVIASESTFKLLGTEIDGERIDAVQVPGKREPMAVYRLA